MKPVRRLAVKISSLVEEWAAPECRQWANGLGRELAYIESDWRALLWALGGLRVSLHRRGTRSMPGRWWWPIIDVLQVVANSVSVCKAPSWHARIAAGLLVLGWASWAVFTVADLLRERSAPPISDIQAYRLFSRRNLQRKLKRYQSPWRWTPLMVPVSLCVGYLMTLDGAGLGFISAGLVILTTALAIFLLCLETPAKIEGRLLRFEEHIARNASEGNQ